MEARTRAPVPPGSSPGRVRARPIARLGQPGGAPGGRAVVAMVASSAQAILRRGFPLSSLRSRWSPSRTYQPPSGSLAHSPVRLEGPRENSGTGVASRPVQPSNAARSSPVRTLMLASMQGVDECFQPAAGSLGLDGSHRPGPGVEVRSAQPPVLRQRRGVHDRADGVEAVADPPVGGQEAAVPAGGAGNAQQRRGKIADPAEQQPGGLGQVQRPVVQGQAHQRGEHRADRQRAGPPGGVSQRGLDDRGRCRSGRSARRRRPRSRR